MQGRTPMLTLVEEVEVYIWHMLGALEERLDCWAVDTGLHTHIIIIDVATLKMQELDAQVNIMCLDTSRLSTQMPWCLLIYLQLSSTPFECNKWITRSMSAWVSSCGEQVWSHLESGKCADVYQWKVEDCVCEFMGQQRCFCSLQTAWILTAW